MVCGEPGRLAISVFVGPLSAHSWTARCEPSPPAAGRCKTAVYRCRVSRPGGHLQTYSSKGEAALLLAGLAGQVTTGRVGRPDVSTTPSATLHILSESGRTPLDRGTAVVWSMAARAGPDPMSNAAAKPASHRGRPSCSSAFLLCVRRVSSQLVRPLRGSKSALSVIAISTHRCRHTRGPLFRAVCVFVRAGAFF